MSAPLPPPAAGEAAAPGGAQFLLVQLTLVEDGVPRDVLAFIGSSDISAEQLEALMHATGSTGAPPAAAAAIAAIPKVIIRVRGSGRVGAAGEVCVDFDEDKVPSCVVCVEDFCDGVEVSKLACGHMFHEGCIGEWLGRHNTCPVCRVELPAEEAAPAPPMEVPIGEQENEGGLFRAMRGILGRRRRRDERDAEVQPPRRSRRLNSGAAGRAAAGASEATPATRTGGSGSVNISSGPAAAVAAAHSATHTGSGSASTTRSASANASAAPTTAGSMAGSVRGNRRPVAVPMPGVPGVNFVLENSEAANGMEAVTVAAVSAALQAAAAQAGLGGIQNNVGHGRSATMAALANLFRGGRGRRGRGRGGARWVARGRGGRGRGRGQ